MSDFDDLFDWGLKSVAEVSMEVYAGKLSACKLGESSPWGVVVLLLSNMDVLYCGSGIGKSG
jgi:hypothetical protein